MHSDHQTDADGAAVRVPRELLEALVRRNEALTARIDELERRLDDCPPAVAPRATDPTTEPAAGAMPRPVEGPPPGPVGRRQVLGRGLAAAGAVAAAGTAAALGPASPVAAANGSNLIIGSDVNTGTAATGLSVQGTNARYGIGVTDNGARTIVGKPALWGHAQQQGFFIGVLGQSDNGASGVVGQSLGFGDGVTGISATGIGVVAQGPTQLWLRPNAQPSPPTTNSSPGSLRCTSSDSTLWACVGGSTWRKVVGLGTAGAFHLLPTPKRVYDSRPGTQPPQGPKSRLPGRNVARTIDLKHNASGVPAGATGVLLTILLVNAATGGGNMTVWADDQPKPAANTMVWGGNAGRFTTTALTAVDAQARVKVDASLGTDLVLDVVGFYR